MTLLLTKSQVAELLDYETCIAAVENAFKEDAPPAGILGGHGFHIKTARLGDYYAMKINGNFPGNRDIGLPTIQGVLTLHDAVNGRVLAIMDSMEVTTRRTAAASAVAAKYLARPDSKTMILIGFGNQGKAHVEAFSHIRNVIHYDVGERPDILPPADIIITCTTSTTPVLLKRDVRPGTFVAAVGTDAEHKQEIAPDLLASSTVVADVLTQCRAIGDLHHAPDVDVHAELHEVIKGLKPGRSSPDEITIFDSTGTALEDVAAASLLLTRASVRGIGLRIALES